MASPERAVVRARDTSGVTLIEMVLSLVIISIAIAGTLIAMQTATRSSADPIVEVQSSSIAAAYLEEILLKPFHDPDLGAAGGPCPAPEVSRDLFDNVCDYDGSDDAGARDQDGNPVPGLSAYRVRVQVDEMATLNDLSGSSDVLRVDVRVSNAPLVDLLLSGYRARY